MIQDLGLAYKINGIWAISLEIRVYSLYLIKLLTEIIGVEDVCNVEEDALKEEARVVLPQDEGPERPMILTIIISWTWMSRAEG